VTFFDGFKLVMNHFGFVVIAWKPDTGEFNTGDAPEEIWGNPTPVPCRVVAPSSRHEWITQNKFLCERGATIGLAWWALKPPAGIKYSRVMTD
jgi:hypothetical protein